VGYGGVWAAEFLAADSEVTVQVLVVVVVVGEGRLWWSMALESSMGVGVCRMGRGVLRV
jgi:hypothetical protein